MPHPARPPGALDLAQFLPESLRRLDDPQKDISRIAKDEALTAAIERTLPQVPTHRLHCRDARTAAGAG